MIKQTGFLMALLLGAAFPLSLQAASPAPSDAQVYIISPDPGQRVDSPVTVKFGLDGMGVAPAGVEAKHTGHHHLLVDTKKLPQLNKPLPSDKHHRHFGGGQTQATLDLKPGRHELRLLLADKNHIPHDPPVISEPVVIYVEE